jgi:hypothetical protein
MIDSLMVGNSIRVLHITIAACGLWLSPLWAGEISLFRYPARHMTYEWIALEQNLKNTPRWDGVDPIPIDPAKAVSIAKRWFKKRNLDPAVIRKIEIRRLITDNSDLSQCWYYLVDATVDPFDSMACLVLMDGSVLEPRVISKDKREDKDRTE